MKTVYIFMIIVLVSILTIFVVNKTFFSTQDSSGTIVSPVSSSPTIVPSPTPILSPTSTTTPSPSPTQPTTVPTIQLSKKSYIIALFGDSYIDTMIDTDNLLQKKLQKKYPGVSFTIYNYGIGAQNVADGLARWDSAYSNRMNRNYPPISQLKPDIIILGSFGYNPFGPHDPGRHKNTLAQVVEKAKQTGAEVYMLAELAPAGVGFGDGPKGVNWSDEQSIEHSNKIIQQIENVFAIAPAQQVRVIDTFTSSKEAGSSYAKQAYVNQDDGIHPSYTGHDFMANIIVSTVVFK